MRVCLFCFVFFFYFTVHEEFKIFWEIGTLLFWQSGIVEWKSWASKEEVKIAIEQGWNGNECSIRVRSLSKVEIHFRGVVKSKIKLDGIKLWIAMLKWYAGRLGSYSAESSEFLRREISFWFLFFQHHFLLWCLATLSIHTVSRHLVISSGFFHPQCSCMYIKYICAHI